MTVKQLHKSLVSNRILYLSAIAIFVILRLIGSENLLDIQLWGATLIQIGIALLIWIFNQTYNIIRQRTTLPIFFYILLSGINPLYFNNITGSVVALLFVICCFLLLQTYQNPQSQRSVLNISLCISLGALYWHPLLWLFPLLWYGLYRMRSLNVKTLLASILGFVLVTMSLFTWKLFQVNELIFSECWDGLLQLFEFQLITINWQNLLVFSLPCLLIVLAEIKILTADTSEKVFTKVVFVFFFVCILAFAVLYLIQNQRAAEWGLILNVPYSLFLAYYFTTAQRPWQSWLFFGVILFFLFLILAKYLLPLSLSIIL